MAIDSIDKSLLIGNNHIRLKNVNSTNKYALDMIAKSKPIEGTVISASFQYEGRGQIGRFWESEAEKNITCSTILEPSFLESGDQFYLNMAVSLAVHDFVDHFLKDENVKIKWPNDIYVDDKKIAGILVQNSLVGKTISSSVIGTGININQVDFSTHIPNPTSFAIVRDEVFDLDGLLPWLFRFLTKRYLQLKNKQLEVIKSEYLDLLYRVGTWNLFHDEHGLSLEGKIIGVDEIGRLILEDRDGVCGVYGFREIRYVV